MTQKKIRILISNDDGIYAPGIYALYKELKKIGDVFVVAPDNEKSAVGHAITLSSPLRVFPFKRNGKFFGYAVNGTPADCVKIAHWALLKDQPVDLLVSGINHGSNTGINVIYSGTASAATEGTILRIPSFAISVATYDPVDFTVAARFARRLARLLLKKGLPPETFLNVNVPPVSASDITGVDITRQGKAVFAEDFDRRIAPTWRIYYLLTGKKIPLDRECCVPVDQVILPYETSITPIHYRMLNYNFLG